MGAWCCWAGCGALVGSCPCPPGLCGAKAKALFARASSWNDTQKRKEVNTCRGETKGFTREIFIYIKRFAQKRTACVRAFTTRGNQQTRTIIILSSLFFVFFALLFEFCVCALSLSPRAFQCEANRGERRERTRTNVAMSLFRV